MEKANQRADVVTYIFKSWAANTSPARIGHRLITKAPFSQKWISLIKWIFDIASNLAANIPSYYMAFINTAISYVNETSVVFPLTPNRCFLYIPHSKCDQKESDATKPSFAVNIESKTNLWRSQHRCPGTRHPTKKYWIADLWRVENKSASPEVQEKAEFKAATELVAKCQYHSLQGNIKWFIWQAYPLG